MANLPVMLRIVKSGGTDMTNIGELKAQCSMFRNRCMEVICRLSGFQGISHAKGEVARSMALSDASYGI